MTYNRPLLNQCVHRMCDYKKKIDDGQPTAVAVGGSCSFNQVIHLVSAAASMEKPEEKQARRLLV